MNPEPLHPSAIGEAETSVARLRRYRETRDRDLRNAILVEHQWIAHYCANRFSGRGEPLDDLVQVAQLGLLKAIERYDPDYGATFSGFAVPTVLGEIRRHFRDSTWAVRVSRRASDLLSALGQAVEHLSQTLSRAPTIPELARYLHVTEDDVLAARDAHEAYRMEPLTEPVATGTRGSVAGAEDAGLDPTRLTLRSAITTLGEDERRIVYLRFYEGLTQREIAARLGTNQVQVSRRLRRIFRRLESGLEPLAG